MEQAVKERPAKKDMSKAQAASQRTFAMRRALAAIAELERQGHKVTLDPPLGRAMS